MINTTVRERIITAFVAQLQADPDVPCPVYRSLLQALNKEDLPAIAIQPGNEVMDFYTHDPQTIHTTHLEIVCVVSSEDISSSIDQFCDPLLAFVQVQVEAARANKLDGLIDSCQIREIQWKMERAEEDFVGAVCDLELEYFTGADATVAGA